MSTPPLNRKKSPAGVDVRWLSFGSLRDYYVWLEAEGGRLTAHNAAVYKNYATPANTQRRSAGENMRRFGQAEVTFEQLEKHSEYQNPQLADEIGAKFRTKLQPLLNRFEENSVNLRKMRYNALGLGVFSFDRASIGLMRMRTGDVQPIDLQIRRMEMELGQASNANDLTRAVTTVKDVFAWFPSTPAASKTIKIYLDSGGSSNVTAQEMLYTGIGMTEVTDFFVSNGYAVEVRILIGALHGPVVALADIAVKRYEDSLDKNLLLTLSSDPMFYRHNGFKGLIATANASKINISDGLGSDLEMGDTMTAIAPADETSIFFQHTYSEAATLAEVDRIISLVTSKNTPTP